MAEPRFQLRLVSRRSIAASLGTGIVQDTRPTGRGDLLVWRLLGANNRELGRSAEQFASTEASLVSIEHLGALIRGPSTPRIALSSTGGAGFAWWWMVADGDVRMASSARVFSRQRECLANYEHFASAAASAALPEEPLIVAGAPIGWTLTVPAERRVRSTPTTPIRRVR